MLTEKEAMLKSMSHPAKAAPTKVSMVCRHCKQSARGLMLLAMLQDAGCKVYPSATHCWAKQEHEFDGDFI